MPAQLTIDLDPDLRADSAAKLIFSGLLNIMKTNEPGILVDTDSEFLHDFRIAVRRTRTGLSQLKEALPEQVHKRFTDFFSWLGQITGPARDLDVYLLNFERYKDKLPVSMREDINPLYEFLIVKKQVAQRELINHLRSSKYRNGLAEWEAFLNQPAGANANLPENQWTIKALANVRLWKNYRRILREGQQMSDASTAETFHELRKACKKLRYLLEFFQSLYPQPPVKNLIKKLKKLQDVLGDIQDYETQEHNLRQFANEMSNGRPAVDTLLAIGVLIQNLETDRQHARKRFESRFNAYRQTKKQLGLNRLFANQQ